MGNKPLPAPTDKHSIIAKLTSFISRACQIPPKPRIESMRVNGRLKARMRELKKNHIILIIVTVLLVFPTPHPRTRHETKYATGPLYFALPIGEKVEVHWVLQGWHQITINLESNKEIRVTFRTADGALYNLTKTVHGFDDIDFADAVYDISIVNPVLTGDDAPTIVSGNMSAAEIVQYQEWWPWLFP